MCRSHHASPNTASALTGLLIAINLSDTGWDVTTVVWNCGESPGYRAFQQPMAWAGQGTHAEALTKVIAGISTFP